MGPLDIQSANKKVEEHIGTTGMPPLEAPQFQTRGKMYRVDGLRVARRFTKDGISPYDTVAYEKRTSVIREPDGTVVFEMKDIEVPATWSQVAVDILAQK